LFLELTIGLTMFAPLMHGGNGQSCQSG